jgi:hypothetical protein
VNIRVFDWATTQNNLGGALETLGERESGTARLEEAVTAYRAALEERTRERVVTGANGPEAGVWVIAETNELPTKYAKMVVTDDLGRYVIPDLSTANYGVWVRG